jgi:single-stranded-DNA-specific exonuclease
MGRAQEVPQWLLASQEATALEGAQRLEALNKARQQTEEAVYQEARAQVEALGELPGALVLAGQGWHLGVLGIVASRLAEEFYRPTVVLALEGDTAKGSARSIAEFDLLSALQRLRGRLLQFGGHRQAAGLKLRRQDLEGFGEALSELALQEVQDFSPALKIDAEVSLRDVDFPLVRELQALEPLGAGNPPALLGARGLRVWGAREVGSGHLKLRLADEFTTREAIGFSLARHLPQLKEGSVVDAAFRAEENEFNGTRSLQLNLQALRSAKNA